MVKRYGSSMPVVDKVTLGSSTGAYEMQSTGFVLRDYLKEFEKLVEEAKSKNEDLNAIGESGMTLLGKCCSSVNSIEYVKLLFDIDKDKTINVNTKDKDGLIPLFYAVDRGNNNNEVIKLLKKNEADFALKCKYNAFKQDIEGDIIDYALIRLIEKVKLDVIVLSPLPPRSYPYISICNWQDYHSRSRSTGYFAVNRTPECKESYWKKVKEKIEKSKEIKSLVEEANIPESEIDFKIKKIEQIVEGYIENDPVPSTQVQSAAIRPVSVRIWLSF